MLDRHFTLKSSLLLIMFSDTKTELTLVTSKYSCTESAFYVAIYCTRIYLVGHSTDLWNRIQYDTNYMVLYRDKRYITHMNIL